jgi:hypothetical protein
MDTGNGNFVRVDTEAEKSEIEKQYPNHGGWFHRGQVVEVEGSFFRVKSVKPTEIRLKLLKRGVL